VKTNSNFGKIALTHRLYREATDYVSQPAQVLNQVCQETEITAERFRNSSTDDSNSVQNQSESSNEIIRVPSMLHTIENPTVAKLKDESKDFSEETMREQIASFINLSREITDQEARSPEQTIE
jgi:hypothetical protein